jgi:hypothetical protein
MKWYEIVNERVIKVFNFKPIIKIDLNVSFHGEERQGQRIINDEDIINTCRLALPKMVDDLLADRLTMKDECRIFNKSNDLNVICQLRGQGIESGLVLQVITVIKKADFKPKGLTITYNVG